MQVIAMNKYTCLTTYSGLKGEIKMGESISIDKVVTESSSRTSFVKARESGIHIPLDVFQACFAVNRK